jgi:hypothetical protein
MFRAKSRREATQGNLKLRGFEAWKKGIKHQGMKTEEIQAWR